MVGSVLGNRYRILREVGAGGMAKVYLAEDISGNDLVAVKVLYPQFSQDISFIQRFNREAKLASTLTDSHIVRVLDYGADRDLQYLVMEYVEGQDLNSALKERGTFHWKYALEILDQLATALEHAHLHGVVHRDIKPQNLMLNDSGLLKVLDFGIARIPTLPSLTQSGFIGSPYYASPEQAMGEEVDIRSDIYSSGIVLYEMLSGHIPFDAKSPWSIISQHITSDPPPIRASNGEIPENVEELLKRMLAKRPDERFQTPTDLRRVIASVFAGQPVPDETQDLMPASPSDKRPLIESLHQRASEAMEAQEWVRAADLLSQAVKLDPKNTELAAKLNKVEAEAQVDGLYKAATRAMESGRWEDAVNHFNVVAQLKQSYKDSAELLEKARQALKAENEKKFVEARYTEGLTFFEGERWSQAVEAFTEVQRLSPGYEQVEKLLTEAKQQSNPTLTRRLKQTFGRIGGMNAVWRWGLISVSIVVVAFLFSIIFSNGNQASGDDDVRQRLKLLYEEAQVSLEQGDRDQAIAKLDQILDENPDYADAADIRRELLPTPTPVVPPTPEINEMDQLVEEIQQLIEGQAWTEAIDQLKELRSIDDEYQEVLVSSLLCDAYINRGLEYLGSIETQAEEQPLVNEALADFEAGVDECPRRIDLADQAERAQAYLNALNASPNDYETLISALNPIVAANPNYASGNAKLLLYNAYLARAVERRESPESIAGALGDYEAALDLRVDDPSTAQTQRAELLLLFSQQPVQSLLEPTDEPTEVQQTPDSGSAVSTREVVETTPTVESVGIKYGKPELIFPENDAVFAGEFADVFLEWSPVPLAEDEYYDLTIMHLFADEPQYTGSRATRENRVQLAADIGVGKAGGDRFYWWVTVRKNNTASSTNSLDRAVSPRSDAGTFIWSR